MENISEFWSTFLGEKEELAKESPNSDSMDRALDSLTKIDSRLYYHIGLKDDSADLIISAEGNPDLMDTIQKIVELSPDIEGWDFMPVYDGFALFGERNEELYPDSVNGDCLFRRVKNGDRPWIPRSIDFEVVFPSEQAAKKFSELLKQDGQVSEVSEYDGAEGHTHQVHIEKEMPATLKNIEGFERLLQEKAKLFAGRNDGWGSFNV